MPNLKELDQIISRIEKVITTIPNKAAVMAVNFSKQRFIDKSWIDKSEKKWSKTQKKRGSTLIKTGRLKRSIRKVHVGRTYAIIGTNVPYARPHNEGQTIEGSETVRSYTRKAHARKAHTRSEKRIKRTHVKEHTVKGFQRKYKRTFKKRQFLGESQYLSTQIGEMITREINKTIHSV